MEPSNGESSRYGDRDNGEAHRRCPGLELGPASTTWPPACVARAPDRCRRWRRSSSSTTTRALLARSRGASRRCGRSPSDARGAWPGRATRASRPRPGSSSPSSTTTRAPSRRGSSGSLSPLQRTRAWSAPAARCCPTGRAPSRAGFRPSSTGSSGAATRACRPSVAPVRNPIGANMAVRSRAAAPRSAASAQGVESRARSSTAASSRGRTRARRHRSGDPRRRPHRRGCIWLYRPGAPGAAHGQPERATLGYFVRRSFEEGAARSSWRATSAPRRGSAPSAATSTVVLPRGLVRGLWQTLRGDPQRPATLGRDRGRPADQRDRLSGGDARSPRRRR